MTRCAATTFADRVAALSFSGADILAINGVEAFRGGPGNVLIRCPFHPDDNPSFSVRTDDGRGHCFGCGARVGDAAALHRALGNLASMGAALNDLERRVGVPIPALKLLNAPTAAKGSTKHVEGTPECVATWTYTDSEGVPVFEIRRIQYRLPDGSWFRHQGAEKPFKTYIPSHPGGSPKGMPKPFATGALRPLYGLVELLGADAAQAVYVVEGEPAADALRSIGWVATTSSGGAMAADKSDWSPLAGRHVVVWPDNDQAGLRYANAVTGILLRLVPAAIVRWVDIAALNLPSGGDAVDWFAHIGQKGAPFAR